MTVSVDDSNVFKMEISATVGGNNGDIAVDDISFSGCSFDYSCNTMNQFACENIENGNAKCLDIAQVFRKTVKYLCMIPH